MANQFPTGLNNYATGSSSATLVTAGHAAAHNALEAKIGVDSSAVITSIDYLLKNTASVDPGHKHSTSSISSQIAVAQGGTGAATLTGILKGNGTSAFTAVTAPSGTIVGTSDSQTLTNKILTTPTITKPIMDATNPSAQTYTPSAAGTATLDLSLGNEHRITMPAGNITIALSNDTNAQKFIVSITQDSSGSRTVTWFTTIKWAGGSSPTLTTTASKRDTFGFIRTGSGTYDGFVVGQNI